MSKRKVSTQSEASSKSKHKRIEHNGNERPNQAEQPPIINGIQNRGDVSNIINGIQNRGDVPKAINFDVYTKIRAAIILEQELVSIETQNHYRLEAQNTLLICNDSEYKRLKDEHAYNVWVESRHEDSNYYTRLYCDSLGKITEFEKRRNRARDVIEKTEKSVLQPKIDTINNVRAGIIAYELERYGMVLPLIDVVIQFEEQIILGGWL